MILVAKLSALPLLAIALDFVPTLALTTDIQGVTFIGQEQGNWCWAASDLMMLTYHHYSPLPRQCDIADLAVNSGCHVPGNCCNGGSCNQQCPDQFTRYYAVHEDPYPVSYATVMNYVGASRPFLIMYGPETGGSHIMVGRGYNSPWDQKVRVYDPSYGPVTLPYQSIFLPGTDKISTKLP